MMVKSVRFFLQKTKKITYNTFVTLLKNVTIEQTGDIGEPNLEGLKMKFMKNHPRDLSFFLSVTKREGDLFGVHMCCVASPLLWHLGHFFRFVARHFASEGIRQKSVRVCRGERERYNREREIVSVCVCLIERERLYVCVCLRERERDNVCM